MAKIPTGPEDYFRNIEKRLSRLERRPNRASQDIASLLGPGIASQAVQIMDWSSSDAVYNGYFHSEVGGINSPDSELSWTGQVIAKDDGTGMQQVWNTDGPEPLYWMRTYAPDTLDPSLLIFTEWKKFATASGFIGTDELDPVIVDQINNPPVPDLTDGEVPTVAPVVTPIGGIGSMFFRWTESPNADPVTYRLHVAADATPALDGTNEVAAGVGLTFGSVRKLKDGTAIVGDGTVIYHAIVTAEDADNATLVPPVAPIASAEVTGIPVQVTTADIAVNAITADMLVANNALFDAAEAGTFTGVNFQTREAAARGIKIGDVDGVESFVIYREDGVPFLKAIPTEGVTMIDGEAKLNSLTVAPKSAEDGTSLAGVTEITRHPDGSPGIVRLTGYTTAPKSAPTVTTGYDTVQFTDDGKWADRYGWSFDGTLWWTTRKMGGNEFRIEAWNTNGTKNTSQATEGTNYGTIDITSSVIVGTTLYVLGWNPDYWPNPGYTVGRINVTTGDFIGGWAKWSGDDGLLDPAIGWDPATSEIMIAQSRESNNDRIRVKRYTISGSTLTASATAAVDLDAFPYGLAGISYGVHDLGVNRYIYTARSGDNTFWPADPSTGGFDVNQTWQAPARRVGFTFTGGKFVTVDYTGTMRTFTEFQKNTTEVTSTVGDFTKWVSNTLANATYETTQSPRYKIVVPKRSKIIVTTSVINTGGANAPDRVHIYVGTGTTDPGRAAMWKQADPAVGIITKEYSTLATSGTVPPSANGFAVAAGTIQRLELADGTLFIDGVGNGSIPAGTFRDAVDARANTRADARIAAKVGGGVVSATIAGGAGVAAFTHGLGWTPTAVTVTPESSTARQFRITSKGSTTFNVQFRDTNGTVLADGGVMTVNFTAIA